MLIQLIKPKYLLIYMIMQMNKYKNNKYSMCNWPQLTEYIVSMSKVIHSMWLIQLMVSLVQLVFARGRHSFFGVFPSNLALFYNCLSGNFCNKFWPYSVHYISLTLALVACSFARGRHNVFSVFWTNLSRCVVVFKSFPPKTPCFVPGSR